jgi:hypothetical protein
MIKILIILFLIVTFFIWVLCKSSSKSSRYEEQNGKSDK